MSYVHGESIIRIALADDDLTLQDLLPSYLDSLENCKVVMQVTNGRDLLEKLKHKPDIDLLLLNIKLPQVNGYEAARKIKQDRPEIKIVFSSAYINELVYCQLISIGVDGFILKGSATPEFRRAIFEVMRQGYYFSGFPVSINKKKLNGYGKTHKLESLITEEELRFLHLICSDKTYKTIAHEMSITRRHCDYIRESLFQKFDVSNRVELALFAYKGGVYT